MGKQPTAEVGGAFFFLDNEGGRERVSLTISYAPSCASSIGGPDCPSETVETEFLLGQSVGKCPNPYCPLMF